MHCRDQQIIVGNIRQGIIWADLLLTMIVVHHLGISQSERIVWLCEELGIEYKLVLHKRDPLLSPESLQSVPGNTTGKAPFVEDTTTGVKLSESAAITEYIATRYAPGKLVVGQDDPVKYAEFLYWFHFANGTLMPNMYTSMFLDASGASDDVMIRQFSKQRLQGTLKLMDDRLASNKWLAGDDFTIAETMSVYALTTQRYWGPQVSLTGCDNVLRWLQDCAARPGYQRAMEKCDPEMKQLIMAEPPEKSMMQAGGTVSNHWKK